MVKRRQTTVHTVYTQLLIRLWIKNAVIPREGYKSQVRRLRMHRWCPHDQMVGQLTREATNLPNLGKLTEKHFEVHMQKTRNHQVAGDTWS